MDIIKFSEVTTKELIPVGTQDYNCLLIKFMESALSGSAAAGVFRHDFSVDKTVKLAVEIARATIEELKRNG